MTIKKKENKNEEKLEEFIQKASSKEIDKSASSEDDALQTFTLRIPKSLIRKIDDTRKQGIGKISRNTWILQAIDIRLNS